MDFALYCCAIAWVTTKASLSSAGDLSSTIRPGGSVCCSAAYTSSGEAAVASGFSASSRFPE